MTEEMMEEVEAPVNGDGRLEEDGGGNWLWVVETLARLEMALLDPSWDRLAAEAQQEFTRDGLGIIAERARLMALKNPVIFRGVDIQRLFTFGKGITIRAVDDDVNQVIQDFLKDERNRKIFSHQALGQLEKDQQIQANHFLRFFVRTEDGRVRTRKVPMAEVLDIITNPQDREEVYFFKRQYHVTGEGGTPTPVVEYYPDWEFNPLKKDRTSLARSVQVDPKLIKWDTPVFQVATNRLGRWGVSEIYPALDWALSFKSFLEQLASVWSALARWAWKQKRKGMAGATSGLEAARKKLETGQATGQATKKTPPLSASTLLESEAVDTQPFRTAGATMSAEDGRRLLLMSVMIFGFPETYYSDVSVGTLATAKSLDLPTELKITDRQGFWKDILGQVIDWVILQAVMAPSGPLKGLATVEKEKDGNEQIFTLTWKEGVDGRVIISFPPVKESDVVGRVSAVVDATTLKGQGQPGQGIPPATAVQLLLEVLGVPDIHKVMEEWELIQASAPPPAEDMAEAYDRAMTTMAEAISVLTAVARESADPAGGE